MSTVKLIVGLANPGAKYAPTRHNAGAWYIDLLAQKNHSILKSEPNFFGYTGRITLANQDVRLLIPTTFMNLSGKAVRAMAHFYQIKTENILVAHDELDLLPGRVKIKQGGSHGGHNGLKDIICQLGNNPNFYRMRIGIGHPNDKQKVVDYVLNKPAKAEQTYIDAALQKAIEGTHILMKQNLDAAMNALHGFSPTS